MFRTNPASNFYVLGPRGFGPFAFPVNEDHAAEREFQDWLNGEPHQMAYGPRPSGQYTLWRQPVCMEDVDPFIVGDEIHDLEDDVLVAAEELPIVYGARPAVDYSEFRFIGQISNYHKNGASKMIEDIFLVSARRSDRIMIFGAYADPSEEDPAPYWSRWVNITTPTYAPRGTSHTREVASLIALMEIDRYGSKLY